MINQAVILCGGLGARLLPFTKDCPKPMVLVNGRPFLYHLLQQLSTSGISNFLLLTGYLSEKIVEYFGDGAQFGWDIKYSIGPVDWDTGRRIYEASKLLDNSFILLYSDNYVQANIKRLTSLHLNSVNTITLTLAPKTNGNMKLSDDLKVLDYDNSRTDRSFNYVEVGYTAVNKEDLIRRLEPNPNINFASIIKDLVKDKLAGALVVKDPYKSISDPKRLEITRSYFVNRRIILVDRDGTINKKAPKGQYITDLSSFEWIEDSVVALKKLAKDGFDFIVISNQACISLGIVSRDTVDQINDYMVKHLQLMGVNILKVYVSPDGWDSNSFSRKPQPGMFIQASEDFNFRLDRTLYIGDDERDCYAALNANCGMVYLNESDDLDERGADFSLPFLRAKSLTSCYNRIVDIYNNWGVI
jgi:histidinol-phosphate phosphatase family protein